MAKNEVYTLGRWLVNDGQDAAFIEAWKELGSYFLSLPEPPGPGPGTLIQSVENPRLFYSFGRWPNAESVAAMRADSRTPNEMERLIALCEEATPGMFRLIAEVGS